MVDVYKVVEDMLRRISDSRNAVFGDYLIDKDFGFFNVVGVIEDTNKDNFSIDVEVKSITDDTLSDFGVYLYNDFLLDFDEIDSLTVNEDFYNFLNTFYYKYIVDSIKDSYKEFFDSYLASYRLNPSFEVNIVSSDLFSNFK